MGVIHFLLTRNYDVAVAAAAAVETDAAAAAAETAAVADAAASAVAAVVSDRLFCATRDSPAAIRQLV